VGSERLSSIIKDSLILVVIALLLCYRFNVTHACIVVSMYDSTWSNSSSWIISWIMSKDLLSYLYLVSYI
jgi:hypothetical protein